MSYDAEYHRQYHQNSREKRQEYGRIWRAKNKEKLRKSKRKYYVDNAGAIRQKAKAYRDANPGYDSESKDRYVEKNRKLINKKNLDRNKAFRATPEGQRQALARRRVSVAVRNGTLIKPSSCETCNKPCDPHAHHYKGYDAEHRLDVVWLCVSCHMKLHHPKER